MFKQNEGVADRVIRIVLGVVLLTLAYAKFTGLAQVVTTVVGVLALGTGAFGYCALYQLLGISTKKAK